MPKNPMLVSVIKIVQDFNSISSQIDFICWNGMDIQQRHELIQRCSHTTKMQSITYKGVLVFWS